MPKVKRRDLASLLSWRQWSKSLLPRCLCRWKSWRWSHSYWSFGDRTTKSLKERSNCDCKQDDDECPPKDCCVYNCCQFVGVDVQGAAATAKCKCYLRSLSNVLAFSWLDTLKSWQMNWYHWQDVLTQPNWNWSLLRWLNWHISDHWSFCVILSAIVDSRAREISKWRMVYAFIIHRKYIEKKTNCILDTLVWRVCQYWITLQAMYYAYVLENLVPCLTTFSTASKKSRSVATLRRARMANIPA